MINISYVRQREQLGLGHAVLHGPRPGRRRAVRGDARRRHHRQRRALPEADDRRLREHGGSWSPCSGCREPRSRPTASSTGRRRAKRTASTEVRDLVEKPKADEAPSDLAIIGRYILTPEIFELLETTPRGKGGEIQLTDGLRRLAAARRSSATSSRACGTTPATSSASSRRPWSSR